jgi:sarcosine oxidase subunit beta
MVNAPSLPLRVECHEAFITESLPPLFSPMVVSYNPNCYFQQLYYTKQIIGCYTPTIPREGIDRNSTFSFLPTITTRILKIIPTLDFIKVLRSWVGWYTMTPDGNPIVGETEVPNFWVVGGASGHGFMFGPALGRETAKMVVKRESKLITEEILIGREFKEKEELG